MITDINEIINKFKAGEMIILIDDEERENEGDLVGAAMMARKMFFKAPISPAAQRSTVKHPFRNKCVLQFSNRQSNRKLYNDTLAAINVHTSSVIQRNE